MFKTLLTLFIVAFIGLTTYAQEGMWLLNQIDQLELQDKGLELATEDIYNPDGGSLHQAIVQLGGGTASFVSPEGLLVTNHHVAYTAIQRTSSTETDYLTEGFLATTRAEEIQAPGYSAYMLLEMEDVTKEVLKVAKGIDDPVEADDKINEKIRKMTEKIEDGKDDIAANVSEMYNGRQYMLFVYKVFNDIRIVYAPPSSIGKYGGDIDNWMWPRHTGDFSFMRVYVAPDGTGAEYSEDNVPYKPEVWLRTAQGDLDEGDFTFVVGFPGFTTRYRTSNSAAWNLNINYPFSIKNFGEIIDIMDELTADDPAGRIKVADMRAGLANAKKNFEGKVEAMNNIHFVEQKKKFEKKFTEWIDEDPDRKEKYGHILGDIAETYEIIKKTKEKDNVYGVLQGLASTPLNLAAQAYTIAVEMELPEDERQRGINEEVIERVKSRMQYTYNNYFEPVDKAMMVHALNLANGLKGDQRLTGIDYIFESKNIKKWVDDAYTGTKLMDMEYTQGLFDKSPKELEALNDPFINIVVALYPYEEVNSEMYNQFAAKVTDLRKHYIDALYEWKGSGMYPDANGSIRFTWGPVKGYSPEDAVWYEPFTSLHGVIAKNTGQEPFDVPEGLVGLYKSKDYTGFTDPDLEDVPVAFLHMGDITGGNSGSPVMNSRGEIIGVVFDGNYEAMISDWQYDYDLQRIISVDMRYVMFVTEKFGNAGFILKEMGVRD